MPTAPPTLDLRGLLAPRSVALVGASSNPASLAGQLLTNLRAGGYRGRIDLVGRHDRIGDQRSAPTLAALDEPVDLALVLVPALAVPATLDDAAEAGVGNLIIFSSGFGETGPEGRAREAALTAQAAAHGQRLLGPNCVGFANRWEDTVACFATMTDSAPLGGRSTVVVAQSGGMGILVNQLAGEAGLACGCVVSTGNEAVVGMVDVVRYFLDDDRVGGFILYVEGARRGRELLGAVREADARGKQVVVLSGGRHRSGARAAVSHTGAIATPGVLFDALLTDAGAIRVDTPDEAVAAAVFLARSGGRRPGRRLGVIAGSGGLSVLAADLAEDVGLEVPAFSPGLLGRLAEVLPSYVSGNNPVDLTPGIVNDPVRFKDVADRLVPSDEIDVLVVCGGAKNPNALAIAQTCAGVLGVTDKPVLVAWIGGSDEVLAPLRDVGIPCVGDLRTALTVLSRVLQPDAGAFSPDPGPVATAAGEVVTEDEVEASLAAGLAVVPGRLVATADEAEAAAAALGYPVALKVVSPDVPHRAAVGALALGLQSAVEVRAAHATVLARVAERVPGARSVAVLVQPMAAPGRELFVGIRRDPSFGPVMAVGRGGGDVETAGGVAFALLPLGPGVAERLARGAMRVGRHDGAPVDAASGVGTMLEGIARWWDTGHDWPDLAEVDINPIALTPDGPLILDALAVRTGPA